jgi:WD40-like Beta Propeller Repeat
MAELRRRGYQLWLAPVVVVAAVTMAMSGSTPVQRSAAGQAAVPPAAVPPVARRITDPPAFALVVSSPRTGAGAIWLMSAATGRMRMVARVGSGNGFALSPDSKSVFVVGQIRRAIEIRRVNVATHQLRFVADGTYPAVSPDGRYLAYATGRQFQWLAVRNLRTGRTRTINLVGLMGKDATFLNQGAVTWLGDGSQIVAMPEEEGTADAARGASQSGASQGGASQGGAGKLEPVCGDGTAGRQCLIVVQAGSRRLTARKIWVRGPVDVLSGDLTRQQVLVDTVGELGPEQAVWSVRIGARRVGQTRLAPLPADALPDAIAPAGDRILYILAGRVPTLWIARLSRGRLTATRKLYTDTSRADADGAAW